MWALGQWWLRLASLSPNVSALWASCMLLSAASDCGTPLMATLLTMPQLLDIAATRVVLWLVFLLLHCAVTVGSWAAREL